ncbi:hypothetical protein SDC9_145012 [bioreactor metagenome]|uniref:Uncharacterized protein n=1 Tax=bioreactor metagenome TaxID=1076179 RepID=A0A645EB07_9ZZZZ
MGFFFGTLNIGALLLFVPATCFLVHFFAAVKHFGLTFQFINNAAFHGTEGIQVFDLNPFAQGGSTKGTDGDISLKADDAFFHIARIDAQLADDGAQIGGIGTHIFNGVHVWLGNDLQQANTSTVQVHQGALFAVFMNMG